LSFVKGTFTSR